MAELRTTFHLTPVSNWAGSDPARPYESPSLADEGFIHCTDGVENMVATANRFYRTEPGQFVVLTIDLDRCGSPWRIDDPGQPFPHIYGPIAREAILSVQMFPRDAAGTFSAFE